MKHIMIIGATSAIAQALIEKIVADENNAIYFILASRDMLENKRIKDDILIRFPHHHIDTIEMDLSINDDVNLQYYYDKCDMIFIVAGTMGNEDPTNTDMIYLSHVNYAIPALILNNACKAFANSNKSERHIVVVSSVAGDRGRGSNYAYGSSKAALSCFTNGLYHHYIKQHPHIKIHLIKPGFIDTPMTYGMKSPLLYSREKAAKDILNAVKKNKHIAYVPWFWKYIMLIIKLIPNFIFKRLAL